MGAPDDMPACPHHEICALAQNIGMKEALRVWESFYCDGRFARCERHKLKCAGVDVPSRLLPNGRLQDPPDELAPVYGHGGKGA